MSICEHKFRSSCNCTVLSGLLMSNDVFYNIQWYCKRTAKALINLRRLIWAFAVRVRLGDNFSFGAAVFCQRTSFNWSYKWKRINVSQKFPFRWIAAFWLLPRAISICIASSFETIITKTCLYNFDFLKLHFYTVKLGFTGVYIIFFFFC